MERIPIQSAHQKGIEVQTEVIHFSELQSCQNDIFQQTFSVWWRNAFIDSVPASCQWACCTVGWTAQIAYGLRFKLEHQLFW